MFFEAHCGIMSLDLHENVIEYGEVHYFIKDSSKEWEDFITHYAVGLTMYPVFLYLTFCNDKSVDIDFCNQFVRMSLVKPRFLPVVN